MAIPLSAIRKYTPEIIALSAVAVVLGAFWSIIDAYQPSHLLDLNLNDAPLVIKLALTGEFMNLIFFHKYFPLCDKTEINFNQHTNNYSLQNNQFFFHFIQLLPFQPFSFYGMLNGSLITVVMLIF